MSNDNTGPVTDPPPTGPGRLSDAALVRLFTVLPIVLAIVLAAAVITGGVR